MMTQTENFTIFIHHVAGSFNVSMLNQQFDYYFSLEKVSLSFCFNVNWKWKNHFKVVRI